MRNTVTAEINLSALRDNLAVVRRLCPHSRLMAVVKADAYGHGLLPAAKALDGADGFAVARLQEALQLRDAGISRRILLLATLLDASDLAVCADRNIDVTAHDQQTVNSIVEHSRSVPLRVWLKLDSGMHRAGLDPGAFAAADRLLARCPAVSELIHMTHFSSADSKNATAMNLQLACFRQCHEAGSRASTSVANSAALLGRVETHTHWVRPGIMLYGSNPLGVDHQVRLRPVMTLRSRVIAVRNINRGETVGYNARWTSERLSRIGTIGIGYGDGYPRHARNGTPVWINGQLVPLVGQVSMDSLTVDLTECSSANVGDAVVLWGEELAPSIVAECAGTISYELFTSVQGRVTRIYS